MPSIQEIISSGIKLTPMIAQYVEIKKDFPDTLLLFRMGDFYELFFDDAKEASKILNITLTHRGKVGDHPVPMAGIPHHAASNYIDKITSKGLKAAICEQIEDPKDAIGIVKRAVTQIVSPGMPYDLEKSNSNRREYMAAGVFSQDSYYLILIDFTTGDFIGQMVSTQQEFIEKLRLYSPREFITYLGQWDDRPQIKKYLTSANILETNLSQEIWETKESGIYIEKLIPSYKRDQVIKQHPGILCPIGGLAYYICSTQSLDEIYHIRPFKLESNKDKMVITFPTLVGLEILPKSKENYKESLLGYFDRTQTAMGTREMREQFLSPLRNYDEINNRYQFIEYLIEDDSGLKELRNELTEIRDLERILTKVSTKKATPTDLINLAAGSLKFFEIQKKVKLPKTIFANFSNSEIADLETIAKKIETTINDEIGATLDKGNLIKPLANKQRDRLAQFSQNAAEEVLKLETKYREVTKINTLKIKFNNVHGYFIEISKAHSTKVPKAFDRKQTLVNAERYITEELTSFEKEVITAKDKLSRLEKQIFDEIVGEIASIATTILKLSKNIGLLDVYQSFAWMAFQDDLVKPNIIQNKQILEIKGAWHPLIKASIKDQFVCHDIKLNSDNFFGLITGPNMAGKTTVMREMAIIQFLAQIGSFVPADSAKLGLCDYLFSRLGASDDITRGQSTFMVEMTETSEIVSHATNKSLIVLDEIGRGTSTYDGLSIAWALVEHFINTTKALTLFSTHYHELIDVVEKSAHAKNFTVETINVDGDVQFLYRLIEEGAAQSFGIHVAKLAGLPKNILFRAEQILKKLELEQSEREQSIAEKVEAEIQQLSLFDSLHVKSIKTTIPPHLKKLEKDISELDVLNMTPIEAIQKLYDLKTISMQ